MIARAAVLVHFDEIREPFPLAVFDLAVVGGNCEKLSARFAEFDGGRFHGVNGGWDIERVSVNAICLQWNAV